MPSTPDALVTTIVAPAPLQVSKLVVQHDLTERSFINYLEVDFNNTTGLQDVKNNAGTRMYLNFLGDTPALSGAGSPQAIPLSGVTAPAITLVGQSIDFDFGANGITKALGGSRDRGHLGSIQSGNYRRRLL